MNDDLHRPTSNDATEPVPSSGVTLHPSTFAVLPCLFPDLTEVLNTIATGGYKIRLAHEREGTAYRLHVRGVRQRVMSMEIIVHSTGSRQGSIKKVTVVHPEPEVHLPNGETSIHPACNAESLTGHPSAMAAIRAALHKYPRAEPHTVIVPPGHTYHPERGVTVPLSRQLRSQEDLRTLPGIHLEVVQPLTRLQDHGMMVRLLYPHSPNRSKTGSYHVEAVHRDGQVWGHWWIHCSLSRKTGRLTEIHVRSADDMRAEWATFTPERRHKLQLAEHSSGLAFGHEFREGRGYRFGPVKSLELLNEVIELIELNALTWQDNLHFRLSQT